MLITPQTHSQETVEMCQKALDKAFSECYFCEDNEATTTIFGEQSCEECANKDIRTSAPLHKMSEKDKALHLKIAICVFKMSRDEDRITKESTDPEELMNWLEEKSRTNNIQGHFKIYYSKFIERWKQLYETTDNIPESFKSNINAKFKGMRKI